MKFIINEKVEQQVLDLVAQKMQDDARSLLKYTADGALVQLTPELIEHIIKMCLNWEMEEEGTDSFLFYEEWSEEEQAEFRGMAGKWVFIERCYEPWDDIMEHKFLPKEVRGYFAENILIDEWFNFTRWCEGEPEMQGIYKLYIALELYRRNGVEGKELNKILKKWTGYKLDL